MRRSLIVLGVLAAGCGGGARQDVNEPAGTFPVEVVRASFPARQRIAQPVTLRLRVRNAGREGLANLAVTVQTRSPGAAPEPAFAVRAGGDQADPARPAWVLHRAPEGGGTATTGTWTAGALRAGETRELTWRLVASRAGSYTVGWRIAPGLTGRARAASGLRTSGSVRVRVSDAPVAARVGAGGRVITRG